MDCRYCGTKMEVYKTDQETHDVTKRELRCPSCKKRALSIEKILQWLSPVFRK